MRERPRPGRGDTDEVEQFAGTFPGALPGHVLMRPYGLRDLVADPVHGGEGGQRVLEDHGDTAAPDAGQLPFPGSEQLLSVEAYGPPYGRARGQQPQDGERGGGLPRPRLAHQAEDFAPGQRETHVTDGGPAVEVDVQRDHFEHRGRHRPNSRFSFFLPFSERFFPFRERAVGSKASRSPSPTRFTASTNTTSSPAA